MIKYLIIFVWTSLIGLIAYAQPVFKGGEAALNAYLKEHIVYPEYSRKNCIEAVIKVRFSVNKNGTVEHVNTEEGLGIDLDDEAVRVVKTTSGKWILPAGVESAALVLPVHFTPDYARCSQTTQTSREQAITNYRNRQELENAVTNYYQNKYAGKADTTKQGYIDALKKELGFDDDLVADLLAQADVKLKQGDTEGACTDWKFIRNIGSNRADKFISQYCK
jgi:TonB family protein